jgi:hypothetical protein
MMDIKHFAKQGLIEFDGEVYKGVVAATYDEAAYSDAFSGSKGRPELMLLGNINNLLVPPFTRPRESKKLKGMFPFDAINLDYTNSVFARTNPLPISDHLNALDRLIRYQSKANSRGFALFVTTRADRGQFAEKFIKTLVLRINDNVASNPEFKKAFVRLYNTEESTTVLRNTYDDFVQIGLVKLIANILSSYRFETIECTNWEIIRDERPPVRVLHHIAFFARPVRKSLDSFARPHHFERRVGAFLGQKADGQLVTLRETANNAEYNKRHGDDVRQLAEDTFELSVPEPEANQHSGGEPPKGA